MAIEAGTLGAAIKQVRGLRGMTQVGLAKAAGLSEGGNSVALIEQGKRSVSMQTLNAIARALDIPSACLAILGSTDIGNNQSATEFMKTLQQLISTVLSAQNKLAVDAGRSQRKNVKRVKKARVRRGLAAAHD